MSSKHRIRVLVVDDSLLFRETLVHGISGDSMIEVVGTAENAYSAREELKKLEPDVMTLDIEMPGMSGVAFLHEVMTEHPVATVVISSISNAIFDALDAGAVDFVAKPSENAAMQAFLQQVAVKIKIASTARVGGLKAKRRAVLSHEEHDLRDVIAIGASTGGTEAILAVLRDLPSDLPGIVIVQHMPPVFTRMYAERLNNLCKIEVAEAKDGDAVLSGKALIAPGGFQMRMVKAEKGGYIVRVEKGEKVNGHAPSVEVLFDSVTAAAGAHTVGVLLTGMGADGANALFRMKEKGAYTIGQDEKSCVVYGMPGVAYQIGAVAKQLPLASIGGELVKWFHSAQEK